MRAGVGVGVGVGEGLGVGVGAGAELKADKWGRGKICGLCNSVASPILQNTSK